METKLEGIEVDAYCVVKFKYQNVISKIVEVTKDYFCVHSVPHVRFNHNGSFRYNTTTKSRSETTCISHVFASRQEAIDYFVRMKQEEKNTNHYSELRQKCAYKVQSMRKFEEIKQVANSLGISHTPPVVTEADVELP